MGTFPQTAQSIEHGELTIPNVTVLDQDGRERHFYDDFVKDKVVTINFIFTSCPTVCPPMGVHFAALQKQLRQVGGNDIALVSVSIDPVTDSPERLAQWRVRFGGEDGWNLVTGQKQEINKLLKMLKVFSADINAHAPFVIMGNDRGGG